MIIGDKVSEIKSPPSTYVGTIEKIDELKQRVYVRWHKGYAPRMAMDRVEVLS
jgi:hypothetical protein